MTRRSLSPRRRRVPVGNRGEGFTLIEVLMAMTIVALVTPFLIGGLISSLTHTRQSEDRGAATAWARRRSAST